MQSYISLGPLHPLPVLSYVIKPRETIVCELEKHNLTTTARLLKLQCACVPTSVENFKCCMPNTRLVHIDSVNTIDKFNGKSS